MKNVPKQNLGRMLVQGELVTVKTEFESTRFWRGVPGNTQTRLGSVFRGRVHKPWRRSALVKMPVGKGYVIERIERRDEGTRWVRGWDTEEALAMFVAEALQ